jgi:sugar phosphate isomerase/epimerase
MPGVALQLYTVREDISRDFAGTLREVARIGYPAVQLGTRDEPDGPTVRALIDELGLGVAGAHVDIVRLETALEEELRKAEQIGHRDLIVPTIPDNLRGGIDGYRELADRLNRLGERCRAAGARLSYHNHAWELTNFDGAPALDRLLAWTDPANVFFEPDVYWIERGGGDPVDYLRRYAGRCPFVHLKDVAPDGSFAEVGEGTLDFAPILAAAEAGGSEWYVVEQDRCARPAMESIALSLGRLRAWGKV